MLGAHIRTLRHARGLTLVQLAEAAELSHPFLSQVERGLARPSMASVERIVRALGTSRLELVVPAPEDRVRSTVVREHEGATGGYGLGTARLLGPEALPFVPLEVTGENEALGELHTHRENEFVLVLEGQVTFDVSGDTHVLGPRQAITIAGGDAHRWCSADGAPYRLLVVKEQWQRVDADAERLEQLVERDA